MATRYDLILMVTLSSLRAGQDLRTCLKILAGKTFAIILNLVKFAIEENSTQVVFRRTSTQLRQNGGIWQEATQVFTKMFGKEAVIRNRDLEIYLPRFNSTIKFSHLQYDSDVNSHLGAQYSVNNCGFVQ